MADAKTLPPQALLLQLLRYEPETGLLFWRERPVEMFSEGGAGPAGNAARWNRRFAEKPALAKKDKDGYLVGSFLNTTLKSHRVIWKMITGEDAIEIDHINGDQSNNRQSNLRNVERKDNARNMSRPADNTSGVIGVCPVGRAGKYMAYIGSNPISYLGCYDTPEEAARVRRSAELARDFHRNHGREKIGTKA